MSISQPLQSGPSQCSSFQTCSVSHLIYEGVSVTNFSFFLFLLLTDIETASLFMNDVRDKNA